MLFHSGKERGGIADRTRHHAFGQNIQRDFLGDIRSRQAIARRLEAHKTTAGRGNANGTSAVISVSDRHHPRGNQRRGTSR